MMLKTNYQRTFELTFKNSLHKVRFWTLELGPTSCADFPEMAFWGRRLAAVIAYGHLGFDSRQVIAVSGTVLQFFD
jgi:hypothetical protein